MFVSAGDLNVHVQIDGPPGAPALLLLHSLGTSLHVWDGQAKALSRSFRVIRPDLRGHGLTTVTSGPYSIDGMARDALAVLDALGVAQAHVGGLSIGGMLAQAIAVQAPERVLSLVLCDTAMAIPPAETWHQRAAAVRAGGMGAVADTVMARWVTPGFLGAPPAQGLRAMLLRTDPEGYAGAAEAIAAADLSSAALCVPALVLVGDQDAATPLGTAEALARAIPGARLQVIAHAAHLPTAEQPDAVTAAMRAFLEPSVADFYEAGMAVRRQVLGEAHVARAGAAITEFDRPFQQFITRTAWGGVWTRPGLDRRTRSLLTLALMAALGHHEEFKLHVRASRNTGATPADISEVLIQVAAYAGIPAANSAVRIAKETFKEMDA
ncbi:bifunctional 3-oxoadipate enol-lactonase/4-carboxymuconolactone decarboxylase PcaDC [Limobrevibacterium gyesilva]|uniref:3-oxoadipate enol-lactonase n=1 Tax=Limobrevibacterium gyesilva TaxID=2991712 RepID=A0AA41YL51_9PROT|nr:3-oxoadipate enol-lactonase [Limobrevibacterium gyesilva]MCW3474247.1 3-oxoadipate enol-lactonase [Limobrevibacterium gyesilva]